MSHLDTWKLGTFTAWPLTMKWPLGPVPPNFPQAVLQPQFLAAEVSITQLASIAQNAVSAYKDQLFQAGALAARLYSGASPVPVEAAGQPAQQPQPSHPDVILKGMMAAAEQQGQEAALALSKLVEAAQKLQAMLPKPAAQPEAGEQQTAGKHKKDAEAEQQQTAYSGAAPGHTEAHDAKKK